MSTSTNEAVFELFREFTKRQEIERIKFNEQIKSKSLKARLLRVIKNPFRIFLWLYRQIYGRIKRHYDYHTKEYIREFEAYQRSLDTSRSKAFNVFVPTEKKFPDARIAVYTAITGGYDDLKDPIYTDDTIDYYAFTDNPELNAGVKWKIIPIPSTLDDLSPARKNRYIKMHPEMHPEEFLALSGKEYDYSVYIDGSLRITCDIKPLVYSLIESGKTFATHDHYIYDSPYDEAYCCQYYKKAEEELITEQMNFYRKEGLPKYTCYFENPVLIRKLNDPEFSALMSSWWEQLTLYSHRDQLSLPYVLWKRGLDSSYVLSLGNNAWKDPFFLYYPHNKRWQF